MDLCNFVEFGATKQEVLPPKIHGVVEVGLGHDP